MEVNQESAKEIEINEGNFNEYFFDARLHGPQKGQVLASYTAVVEFGDGTEKRQIIELLRHSDKTLAAIQVMKKGLSAKEADCYRVLREMTSDLLAGKSPDKVAKKTYKFVMEMCFWTRPEYIPTNDPHWACISILNMDEHFAKRNAVDQDGITVKIANNVEKAPQNEAELSG